MAWYPELIILDLLDPDRHGGAFINVDDMVEVAHVTALGVFSADSICIQEYGIKIDV